MVVGWCGDDCQVIEGGQCWDCCFELEIGCIEDYFGFVGEDFFYLCCQFGWFVQQQCGDVLCFQCLVLFFVLYCVDCFGFQGFGQCQCGFVDCVVGVDYQELGVGFDLVVLQGVLGGVVGYFVIGGLGEVQVFWFECDVGGWQGQELCVVIVVEEFWFLFGVLDCLVEQSFWFFYYYFGEVVVWYLGQGGIGEVVEDVFYVVWIQFGGVDFYLYFIGGGKWVGYVYQFEGGEVVGMVELQCFYWGFCVVVVISVVIVVVGCG